jgi:hypothetical protein
MLPSTLKYLWCFNIVTYETIAIVTAAEASQLLDDTQWHHDRVLVVIAGWF